MDNIIAVAEQAKVPPEVVLQILECRLDNAPDKVHQELKLNKALVVNILELLERSVAPTISASEEITFIVKDTSLDYDVVKKVDQAYDFFVRLDSNPEKLYDIISKKIKVDVKIVKLIFDSQLKFLKTKGIAT